MATVLIVDDAVVIRRLLSDVLGADHGLQIVGAAAHHANKKLITPQIEKLLTQCVDIQGTERLLDDRVSLGNMQ